MKDEIKVYNDRGEEQIFHVLEQTQINGMSYLLAAEESDGDELEAWIFKQVGTKDEDVCYEIIEDETELEAVMGVFEELLDDCEFDM